MRLSKTGMSTTKLSNIDEMYPGQSILLQSGQLSQVGAGIYAYNNVPLLVKRNLCKIITEEMNKCDAIEIELPTLQPEKMWKDSGRYDQYVNNGTMLTIQTNKGNFCLAPTAEEAVLEFAKERLKTYKNLPTTYYQIGEKYRNEIRTRGYLLKGKSFPMFDAYSFDENEEGMVKSYNIIKEAYLKIFKKIELPVMPIAADNGEIGGKKSEEFMMISKMGEDKILVDKKTGLGLNTEILERENAKEYLEKEYGITDISQLEEAKTIELGHIFQIGLRYSEMMDGTFINKEGKKNLYYMGCYGIGISRVVATIYEANVLRDKQGNPNGFSLPKALAPYKLQIICKMDDEEKVKIAEKLYSDLQENGIDCIIDDRENIQIGAKIKDCRILGTPNMLIIGDKFNGTDYEIENIKTEEKVVCKSIDEIIKAIELV